MAPIIPDQQLPKRSDSGMATRAVNAAARVLLAAIEQGRCTPTGLALALDSACLLNSPETARELARLRARFAELERPVDEDPIAFTLTPEAEQAVDGLTRLLAPTQALQAEDPHDSPLHHDYRVSRDLPEVTR